jgi:hypothetical protein
MIKAALRDRFQPALEREQQVRAVSAAHLKESEAKKPEPLGVSRTTSEPLLGLDDRSDLRWMIWSAIGICTGAPLFGLIAAWAGQSIAQIPQ